ncbi:hypothetical protein SAMN05216191_102287 [Paenibacillus jilunlii]|uniref:Uncharacterized protein n=1 Tax=Paenibacillus jilunlii TaxID=682956 RepID=A0A1G9J1F0_9BACL|nr:hypothetical protein AML91_05115 [Paenibacillus jilunlii]SDL31300.1 hypothetical protein SAMN05216191_102287 [Paenibacillus jilunlii]
MERISLQQYPAACFVKCGGGNLHKGTVNGRHFPILMYFLQQNLIPGGWNWIRLHFVQQNMAGKLR